MNVLSSMMAGVLTLHGLAAYALVGGLSFAEAAVFVGFVFPGETAVILGGVLAHEHQVSLPLMAAVAVMSAILGDTVGYEVGRHFGPRLLASRPLTARRASLERAQETLRNKGGRAVFFARFTAFLRAVMPGLAGIAVMPYRRFLLFNAAGGAVWGIGFTLLGYLAGASYESVQRVVGRASEAILVVFILAVVGLVLRRRRRERAA